MPRQLWRALALTTVATLALGTAASAPALAHGKHGHHAPDRVTDVIELNGPRGVESIRPGLTLVSEADASFSLVIERRHREARKISLGSIPGAEGIAPAVAAGRHGTVYVLTGAGEPGGPGGKLYRWHRRSGVRLVADIAAYQAGDPDPYDLEELPEESNPYGLEALRDGSLLVVDAAGNDLLRVWPGRHHRKTRIRTVAEFEPRTVAFPEGLPETDPEGNPLPPAGTMMPSESVPTSVTVGKDGYWYVGELRGFPATPGTSQVWRIKPTSKRTATCDPEKPWRRDCKRYADGFTSITDMASDRRGNVYALSLSTQGWLAMELGAEGSEVGALHRIDRRRRVREVAEGQLVLPGGVDVARNGTIYGVGPLFGPGSLHTIR